MVARAEPAARPGLGAGLPDLRRDSPARCLGDPALSPQHPPPAALRDDQPRRAGESATAVRRPGLSLGAAAHAPADADLPAGVPPLCRADGDLPGRPAAGERLEFAPFPVSTLARALAWDSPLNPARPLPPVGGLPRLHGIEPHEVDVTLPLGERVGHTLVLGTTRVGKTRLAELFITQDIRRKVRGEHEVVIVFDPKGDADLLKRMYVEAKRAGREGEFYVFHLGWPDISARYNAVGRFGRISEVATRIAGQLSGEGNSAAFREFAWRFVNIIARALVELGQRPDYLLIQRHVINIDALFIEYAQHYFAKNEPKAWEVIVQLEAKLNDKNIPRNMIGREKRVVASNSTCPRCASMTRCSTACAAPCATTGRTSTRSSLRCCRCWRSSPPARSRNCSHRTIPTCPTRGRSSTGCRSSANARWFTWAGCAVRRRSRGGGGQLDVQRSGLGRRPHLQVRHRRRAARRRGGRQDSDQRPRRRIQ